MGELLSFESKKTSSGNFTYSAPDGQHDDCVMSLALAWYAVGNGMSVIDNLVAMQDLGEYNAYASSFVGQGTSVYPSDQLSNNLYQKLTTTYSVVS